MVTLTAWILAAVALAGTGGGQSPAPLIPGVPVELPISDGAQLTFSFTANPGEGIKVAVDQLGADVAVELAVDGAPKATADEREKHRYGRELLVWAAPAAGTVVLKVRAQSVMPAGARFRVLLTIYPADDRVSRAIAGFNEGRHLPHPSGEALARAAAAWQTSIAGWRTIGDAEMLAASLDAFGELQEHDLRTPTDAFATDTEAIALFEQLGLHTELYFVLQSLGNAQLGAGQIDRAMTTFERAYKECDDIDPINCALAARNIVRAAQETGDLDRAAAFGERAIAALRGADAPREEMFALEQLAVAYTRMHRTEEALALADRAVALSRLIGSDSERATVRLVVGRVQSAAGDAEAALAAYLEALPLFRPSDVNRYATAALAAAVYIRRGEPQRARDLLEPLLDGAPRQLRDVWAAMANQLGNALTSQGHPDRALPLQLEALDIVVAGQSRAGQLTILRDVAATYRTLGDFAKSNEMLDRAEKVGGETSGDAYATLLLHERARTARAAKDYSTAAEYLNRALPIIESERGRLQSEAFRSLYGAASSTFYADVVDTEMRLHADAPSDGHDARAFELFERSRARSLSDLIAERALDIHSGVDAALVAEQRSLQRQLGVKDAAVRDLAATPRGKERAATIERDIGDIERRLAVVDAQIRAANPRYAALQRPQPATLEAAQRLLDETTVLIAISLGPEASWGWAVTVDSVRPFELPPAATVNDLARKVYEDLTARQDSFERRSPRQIADIDRDLTTHTAALSEAILGPIAQPLDTEWRNRRLAIVATGALQYIPFAALPSPHRTGSRAAAAAWLIDRHELVQLPSMSVLAELRRATVSRRQTGTRVAVLADPVYAADDPRVAGVARPADDKAAATAQVAPAVEALIRGFADTPRRGFNRLVFSRDEAKAISALAAPPRVFEALDFDASVRTMNGRQVAAASVIHIASHGIFNSARPQLSGLALSMVDKAGRPMDGVLHLYDVLNLKLSADFVVLSGCETGLGREIEGEGLVGLSRAFMYAGVPRVIASLWEVDDLATAELMRRFYRAVLVGRLRPAAALAAAQRQMRQDPRWRSPYYWAAFTLVGDWR